MKAGLGFFVSLAPVRHGSISDIRNLRNTVFPGYLGPNLDLNSKNNEGRKQRMPLIFSLECYQERKQKFECCCWLAKKKLWWKGRSQGIGFALPGAS